MRLELADEFPVDLNNSFLGVWIHFKDKLGSDGTLCR